MSSPFDRESDLAHYVLGEDLGFGAFSKVRRCRDKRTDTEYAIKIIDSKQLSRYPDYQPEKLMREVELLKQMRHPNIISLHAAYHTGAAIFLVTELATGGELFDHIIARGHYTEPDAREIVRQVLQAVVYLHDQDVIHRDIKPENILVSDSGSKSGAVAKPTVKLSDFGLAKFIGEGAQMAMTTCGTPTYSAPEVWTGSYTNKVDCYSVGVLMFVMLSGHFPKVKSMGPIFEGKVWKQVSRDAEDLILQLMQPDASKRASSKAALEHPWIIGEVPCTPLSSARERIRQDRSGPLSFPASRKCAEKSESHPTTEAENTANVVWNVPNSPPILSMPPRLGVQPMKRKADQELVPGKQGCEEPEGSKSELDLGSEHVYIPKEKRRCLQTCGTSEAT